MADLKNKQQDSAFTPELGGSVFINNTSYSGCDIKVVVNIYDQGKSANNRARELQDEQAEIQAELDEAQQTARLFRNKVNSSKPGTPDFNIASGLAATFDVQVIQLQQRIASLQDQIKDLAQSDATVSTKVLAEVQTLSVSTHRDKNAVRSCGSVYPKAFTRGPRMIAGNLIFTVFDEHVLYSFLEAHATDFDADRGRSSAMLDQIPPVDITVSFANEYGSISRMALYGVEFIDEGQVMSIEDIMTENTVNWVARDMDPMRAVSDRVVKLDSTSQEIGAVQPKRASDLLLEEDHRAASNNINPFTRFKNRRNPFA